MLDIVISGLDSSGTTTQVQDAIDYFQKNSSLVRDLRGSDIDALFHADKFDDFNSNHIDLESFLNDPEIDESTKLRIMNSLAMEIRKMRVVSFVKTDRTNYADPKKADVWVLEEPPRRGSGLYCRVFEQNRAGFGLERNPLAEAHSHADYRVCEGHSYRIPARNADRIILRSRSEESTITYQQFDEEKLSDGILWEVFIEFPGHEIAFGFPPTHILIAHGPENWTREDYVKFVESRSKDRIRDDFEKDVDRQLLVNARYAHQGFLESAYEKGCRRYGREIPEIIRFDARMPMEDIRDYIHKTLARIT